MTYDEALNIIHSNFWMGSKPGLSRTRALLDKMGNPQDKLRFIHVAGTNGKGSFCAMLSSVLTAAGYKVGTYTSPYILRFNERMRINGKDIEDQTLVDLLEYILPFSEEMEEKPTEFELITAIAMEYFAREQCDVVVLECGMGGRLDSTNVIRTPLLCVITGIALDHTAFLGNTIEEIAREKAGILKEKIPVLYCGTDPVSRRVIEEKAKELECPFHTVRRDGIKFHQKDLSGTRFSWGKWNDLFLPLLGSYQPENAQNVLKALSILDDLGLKTNEESVRLGFENVRWPARFELVLKDPVFLCDGGHNPQGVRGAVKSAKLYFGDGKFLVISAMMADKDRKGMVASLSEIAREAFCITPNNPRALPGKDLAKEFSQTGIPAKGYSTPKEGVEEALKMARASGLPILCVGSLYQYGEIVEALKDLGEL